MGVVGGGSRSLAVPETSAGKGTSGTREPPVNTECDEAWDLRTTDEVRLGRLGRVPNVLPESWVVHE
jgi:hypothetical protein